MNKTAPELERLERERQFHNEWAGQIRLEDLLVRESFEACTAIENRFVLEQMGNLKGKKLLDLGCGAGETSVYFALQGAEVYATDLSDRFLEVARALSEKFGVILSFAQTDAGRLPFKEGQFDFVFGNGVLHHVDLPAATKEIVRVLKPGGKAFFVEPLPYNPAINVYRAMAKGVRTDDETPLTFRQIKEMRPFFSQLEHREFWLFSLLIFFHFYFIRRWNPSKVRYWKKVIEDAADYSKMFSSLQRLDEFALNYFPFLRLLCWNTVIAAKK